MTSVSSILWLQKTQWKVPEEYAWATPDCHQTRKQSKYVLLRDREVKDPGANKDLAR